MVKSRKGVTNTFSKNHDVAFITNWGQSIENGNISYRSGIYLMNNKGDDVEKVFDKGFFTSGTFFNDHIYVLSFDPNVKEEQLLKLNLNGELVKKFTLGQSPRFEFRSMVASNDYIYMFSNDGKLLCINLADEIEELPLTTKYEKVFKVFNINNGINILFYNGDLLQIKNNSVSKVIKLQNQSNEHLIGIQALLKGDVLHVLYSIDKVYHGSSFKYEGLIRQYNINDGSIIDSLYLEKQNKLRLADFELYHNE